MTTNTPGPTLATAPMQNCDLGSIQTLNGQGAATITSNDIQNPACKGVAVVVNIASLTGSPSMTVTIQGKDQASGQYWTILASAAITVTGKTVLTVYPGIAVTANQSASAFIPRTWNVSAVITGSGTLTGTIGASMVQ